MNCRREVSKWRKNNISGGEKHISQLKRALERIQNDDNRSYDELVEIT